LRLGESAKGLFSFMEIGILKMHEQLLGRACFCDVVADVNQDATLVKFYKIGKLHPFLTAIYTDSLGTWSMYYNGDIVFQEFTLLSDLIRMVCLTEFKKNMELNYPFFSGNEQTY